MKIVSKFSIIIGVITMLILTSCTIKDETGPGEVRWDRVICERCLMACSDHFYTGQIRGGEEGKRTKLYYFDDIGCAVLWLENQTWKDNSRTEMWIPEYKSGEWIDAFDASYVKGQITPMDFGLGAVTASSDETISYNEAIDFIHARFEFKLKKKMNKHKKMGHKHN